MAAIQMSEIYMLLGMMTSRLDDHNYITWSYQFQTLLESGDLFGYIDGSSMCPPKYFITEQGVETNEISAIYNEWKKTDKAILSLLIAALSFDVMEYVVGSETSREAWLRLNDRYATVSRSHVMQLKTDLYTISKGMDSIEKYLLRVTRARNQLAALGVKVEDDDIVVMMLNGLPADFNLIKAIIRDRESSVSISELRILLLNTEKDIRNKEISSIPASIFVLMKQDNTDNVSGIVKEMQGNLEVARRNIGVLAAQLDLERKHVLELQSRIVNYNATVVCHDLELKSLKGASSDAHKQFSIEKADLQFHVSGLSEKLAVLETKLEELEWKNKNLEDEIRQHQRDKTELKKMCVAHEIILQDKAEFSVNVQTAEDRCTYTWDENDNNGVQHVGFDRDVNVVSVYLDHDLEPTISNSGFAKIFSNSLDEEIYPRSHAIIKIAIPFEKTKVCGFPIFQKDVAHLSLLEKFDAFCAILNSSCSSIGEYKNFMAYIGASIGDFLCMSQEYIHVVTSSDLPLRKVSDFAGVSLSSGVMNVDRHLTVEEDGSSQLKLVFGIMHIVCKWAEIYAFNFAAVLAFMWHMLRYTCLMKNFSKFSKSCCPFVYIGKV